MRTSATRLRLNPFTSDEVLAIAAAPDAELLAELARRYPEVDLSAITAPPPED